jgi:hypothetical protein
VDGLIDFSGPVIKLSNLLREDLYVLLTRLRHLQALGNPSDYLIPDEAIEAFMEHCSKRIGDSYFRTPRTTIISFLGMLSVLEQNPEVMWTDLVDKVDVVADTNPDLEPIGNSAASADERSDHNDDDELASFKL